MDLHTQLTKNMEDVVTMIESRMNNFDKALASTQSSLQSPSSSASGSLSALASEFSTFKELVWKTLAMLRQQLQLLTKGFDEHEMHARRKVLLLHGLPEASDEQVEKSTCDVFHKHLKLLNIDSSSIDVCHRIGVKKDKPRPILVRFTTMKHKNLVWTSKTNLKGSGFTITEFLTKPRQELFVAARKHFGMKYCWTADGAVVIALPDKSRKKIANASELQALVEKFPQESSAQDQKPARSRRAVKTLTK